MRMNLTLSLYLIEATQRNRFALHEFSSVTLNYKLNMTLAFLRYHYQTKKVLFAFFF